MHWRRIIGQHPRSALRWEAREVVRDIEDRPHLLTRITLTGGTFPERSLAPFVKIGFALTAWVEIDRDELSARAYFRERLPSHGVIELGYGNQVVMRIPQRFDARRIRPLDRARLPEDTVIP